jgi:hypothetical protein
MTNPQLPDMGNHLEASAALVEFFRLSQVLPRIESDEKGWRHVEIRALVKPLSPDESLMAGISVRDVKDAVPLEALVREWQERFKAMDAHLDTQPASLADEDLALWNQEHDVLFAAVDSAERALAAFPVGRGDR